jgi:hypothetical protein
MLFLPPQRRYGTSLAPSAAVRLINCRASAGRPGSFHLEYIAR